MVVLSRPHPLRFLVTPLLPCPYLPGRMERKIATELSGRDAGASYEALSRAGFRRSHAIAYRPACPGCSACVPVRVAADAYRPGRSLRRVERRNGDLAASSGTASATPEQYRLFGRYLDGRHGDGEMTGMTFREYRAMVEDSPIDTRMIEFRDADGRLVACCLADRTGDGLSAVYSFFDTAVPRRSLGSFMVVWLIREAQRSALPYVYLGYWVAGSRKMAYKTRFRPMQKFGPTGWRPLTGD
ncbi:MAG: arginyltransferase [Dongiaceae bacterium]